MLKTGYLGRAAMDPEPGRCRRTDGKKWRCSRDVFAGHKYCERHMHRGRNRSRKPVETPTTVNATATSMASSVAAAATTTTATTTSTFAFGGGGGSEEVVGQGGSFFFSGSSNSSSELLHLSQSCSEMKQESNNMNNKRPYESHIGFSNNRSDGGHILRPFFDDWPRSSLQEADNSSSPMSSATCLSISMPGNSSSDVSLKLSTGNEEGARSNNNGRDQQNMSWWSGGGSNHHHHNMGGPLAEALRSSSSSSPTSVLHQLGVSTQAFH